MLGTILLAGLLTAAPSQVGAPDWQRASQYYLQGWSELPSDPVRAEREFQQAIGVYKEFPLAHYGLGRSMMAQGTPGRRRGSAPRRGSAAGTTSS